LGSLTLALALANTPPFFFLLQGQEDLQPPPLRPFALICAAYPPALPWLQRRTVISEVSPGLRIKGEVIRRAAVVAAPEPEKAAEAPEAEASEAEASEAEAAPEA